MYLDGEFAFGLSRIVAAWLYIGQVLDDEKIVALQDEDTREKAYQRALQILNYRSRSEKEIVDKLKDAGYSEKVVDYVTRRLKDLNLLGDLKFARTWTENRASLRPRSRRMLRMELKQKGVDEQTIEQALEDAPDDTELAESLAEKYQNRLRDTEWPDFQKKLGSYLMRKGFDYPTTKDVVRAQWEKLQAENYSGEN